MGCTENKRKNNRRKKLYNENPFCPDCKKKMILPEDVGFITLANGCRKLKTSPKNLCTIEHIYTVNHPKRRQPNTNNEERWMILCKKCNKIRGDKCKYNKKKLKESLIKQKIRQEVQNKVQIESEIIKISFFKTLINNIKQINFKKSMDFLRFYLQL